MACLVTAFASAPALAKLPAPSDEAKAKAAEAAAKTAHGNKLAGFQLCQAINRVATVYFEQAKKAGKDVKPAASTDACADPGTFVYAPPVATPPLEASGAHSPAATALGPPGSKTPQAPGPAKK